jgi:nicotinamidase-related amidase
MPEPLSNLLAPDETALLTVEMQRGIVGDLAKPNPLTERVAEKELVNKIASLGDAARSAGARVIHCTTAFRSDRAGTFLTTALVKYSTRDPEFLLEGSDSAALVPQLGPADQDLISHRNHGVAPFGGTSLDPLLRSLGVKRIVVTGVAVNLAILGCVIEAVNAGYEVFVVDDAVAGFPEAFEQEILERSIALLARRVTTDDVVAAWSS